MMDVVIERCAGLDVHRDSVVATVRVPGTGKSRRRREQRTPWGAETRPVMLKGC
jgi:transposase